MRFKSCYPNLEKLLTFENHFVLDYYSKHGMLKMPSTIYLCLKDDEPYIPSDSPSVSNLVPVAFLSRGEGGREKPREQGCCCSMYSVMRKGNHTLFARSRLAYQATLTPEGKQNIYIYI